MDWLGTILIGYGLWAAAMLLWRAAAVPWLSRGPLGDPATGLMWRFIQLYGRLVHRVRYVGRDRVPAANLPGGGGMLIVSNHTGSADPLLIQAACPFLIRWLMARETMFAALDWLWDRFRMIPVDRDGADLAPVREAIRILREGGVVGIFPEGRIAWPPREVRPFFNGVGLIVARTRAPVLLVWVSGTPSTNDVLPSLLTSSHAQVWFIDRIDFGEESDAADITQSLRQRLALIAGWPLNDEPMPDKQRPAGVPYDP
jgi:1-acyl-sn-glycerol-3-phosphate acyltransferase